DRFWERMRWADFGDARFDWILSVVHPEVRRAGSESGRADPKCRASICRADARTLSPTNDFEVSRSQGTGEVGAIDSIARSVEMSRPAHRQPPAILSASEGSHQSRFRNHTKLSDATPRARSLSVYAVRDDTRHVSGLALDVASSFVLN